MGRYASNGSLDAIILAAANVYGQAYADLLRADIEIAKRERDNPPVPPAWHAKRRRMARALDQEREQFRLDLWRARMEFWRRSTKS